MRDKYRVFWKAVMLCLLTLPLVSFVDAEVTSDSAQSAEASEGGEEEMLQLEGDLSLSSSDMLSSNQPQYRSDHISSYSVTSLERVFNVNSTELEKETLDALSLETSITDFSSPSLLATQGCSEEMLSDTNIFTSQEEIISASSLEAGATLIADTRSAVSPLNVQTDDSYLADVAALSFQNGLVQQFELVDSYREDEYEIYGVEEDPDLAGYDAHSPLPPSHNTYSSSTSSTGAASSFSASTSRVAGSTGAAFFSSATSSASEAVTPDPIDLVTDYRVDGTVTLTAADNLYFGSSLLVDGFELNILGTDVVLESGEIDYSTLDGAGLYSGFYINKSGIPASTKAEINLKGIKNFENFKRQASVAYGGVISLYRGGTVNFGDQHITFSNNHAVATSSAASGGVFFVDGGAYVSGINADFYNNSATKTATASSTALLRGGAIYVADASSSGNLAVMGDIHGVFDGNMSSHGGAIYVGTRGKIGNVSGVFSNNFAEGSPHVGSTTGGSNGGAIRVWEGSIGSLDATFTGNVCHSIDGSATGGAVSLHHTLINGGVTGHYEDNIVYSNNSAAQGGAYALKSQIADTPIVFTNTDFINNVAGSSVSPSSTVKVQGGAFYIEDSSDVFFVADGQDVTMSGNYTIKGATWDATTGTMTETAGSVKDYNAIYANDSIVTLRTTEGKSDTITINDSILGEGKSILVVEGNGDERYDVHINDSIGLPELVVKNGGVELGTYSQAGEEDRVGKFSNNANLTVHGTGIVKANANSLDRVGEVDLQGTSRENAGILELTGGILNSNINGVDGAKTGHVDIIGATAFAKNNEVYTDTINVRDTLTLMEESTVDVNTLLFHGYDMNDVNNGGNQIKMDTSTLLSFTDLELHFSEANPGDVFNLIVSDDGVGVIDVDWSETTVFALAGKYLEYGTEYVVEERADGGVDVRILIRVDPPVPEPSSVVLGVLALAATMMRRRRRI